jgi:hypothetical protein
MSTNRRRKRIKLGFAWVMTLGSAAGMVATQLELIGSGEPKVVLQLSWAALLFTGFDGLLISTED